MFQIMLIYLMLKKKNINYLNIKELSSEFGNVNTLELYYLQNLKELPSGLSNVHTLKLYNLPNIKKYHQN